MVNNMKGKIYTQTEFDAEYARGRSEGYQDGYCAGTADMHDELME
jgi:flagellar biosynthesis/type III secretory pathway protein FliH